MTIQRGDVVLIEKGSEQGKVRPCLIIQNDIGNKFSPTTIVAAITSNIEKEYPFTVFIRKLEGGLPKDSLVLCNHIRTISVDSRVIKKLGSLKPDTMRKVDEALKKSLAVV